MSAEWSVKQISPTVHRITYPDLSADWQARVLLRGDAHHDNVHNRWDIEQRHLELAKEHNAAILDVGDLFCAMQGKYDPRKNMDDIKAEHVGADYLDRLVSTTVRDYKPYANQLAVLAQGNHESSILTKQGTNLTDRLAAELSKHADGEHRVFNAQMRGWVQFRFQVTKTRAETRSLYYAHGAGGAAPVTRGTIQTNRRAAYVDADVFVSGHNHTQWVVPLIRKRLNGHGRETTEVQHHVKVGTYKDEWSGEFSQVKDMPPKTLGAVWMHIHFDRGVRTHDGISLTFEPMTEV